MKNKRKSFFDYNYQQKLHSSSHYEYKVTEVDMPNLISDKCFLCWLLFGRENEDAPMIWERTLAFCAPHGEFWEQTYYDIYVKPEYDRIVDSSNNEDNNTAHLS